MEHRAASEAQVIACYRELAPHPALRGIVRALFSFTSRAEERSQRRITFEIRCTANDVCPSPMFADSCASIVFDIGQVFYRDGTWRDNGAAYGGKFIGAMRRGTPPSGSGLAAAVGAYLHPGQLSRFAHAPSRELTDRILPIEGLWGQSMSELSARLATITESERIDLLEKTLTRQMVEPRERGRVDIHGVATCITQAGGRVSITSLAMSAGLSRQQFTRLFRERVGVSPKVFARLARFRSALSYVRSGDSVDWARVASDGGYADQSHMIAEFREFSSLTPHMLATQRWLHPFIERAKRAPRAEAHDP